MKNPFTPSEIQIAVTSVLSGVLGIKQDEIDGNSAIVDDLGADSLDFVELNSSLEKKLNLSLPKKGTLYQAGKINGQPEQFYDNKRGLTEDGLALLENSLSKYKQLAVGMTMHDIFNATTVNNLANLCHGLLNFLPAVCPECGHGEAKVSAAGKVVCAACSVALRPLHGDDADSLCVTGYLAKELVKAD